MWLPVPKIYLIFAEYVLEKSAVVLTPEMDMESMQRIFPHFSYN